MAKSAAKNMGLVGRWAFLIGVILAVVIGLIGGLIGITLSVWWVAVLLMVIGLVVGFLNVNEDEAMPFVLSGTALVIISYMGKDALTSVSQVQDILNALSAIFVPATIIVAVKNVFNLAKE